MNKTGTAALAAALVCCCVLNGCVRTADEAPVPASGLNQHKADGNTPMQNGGDFAAGDMPAWLDLYRKKNVVDVATVDHVVIITFETQARRDEVYDYYSGRFRDEENFSSSRENRDIISFIKEGYGAKVTLLNESRNIWSLEYHRQSI